MISHVSEVISSTMKHKKGIFFSITEQWRQHTTPVFYSKYRDVESPTFWKWCAMSIWVVISSCTDHIFNLLPCSVVALPCLTTEMQVYVYVLFTQVSWYPVILWCGQHMLIGTSCLSCFSSFVLWTILYSFCV